MEGAGSSMNEQDLVQYIAENLVNNPDKVSVERRESGRTVALGLTVAPDDMGRVIGRNGRVANAIRALLRAVPPADADDRRERRRRIILEIE